MEKIDFRNNQQPALNETNLNKLQDNVEDAISESEETQNAKVKTEKTNSDTDTYSCNYINNKINGEIIYSNSSGSNGNISFTKTIDENTTLEIEYKCNTYGYKTIKLENALNKKVILNYETVANTDINQSGFAAYNINSNGMSLNSSGMINTNLNGTIVAEQGNNLIYITKVRSYN